MSPLVCCWATLLIANIIIPPHSEGARIIFLLPASTHSETYFFEPLIHQLSFQHNVTAVTALMLAIELAKARPSEQVILTTLQLTFGIRTTFLIERGTMKHQFLFQA